MKKLAALGEQPRAGGACPTAAPGGCSPGHFETPGEAEPILDKLGAQGYEELWVSTEKRPGKPREGPRPLRASPSATSGVPCPTPGWPWCPPGADHRGRARAATGAGWTVFPNAQGRLTVVNTLDLETYLRGVVPREMGAWEYPALEALKAQAVAARTYAYVNLGKRAKEGFDLVDTVADQVYGGRDGEQALTDRAVAGDRRASSPPTAASPSRPSSWPIRRRHHRQHLRLRRRLPLPQGRLQLRRRPPDPDLQGRRGRRRGTRLAAPGKSCAWPRAGLVPPACWNRRRMAQPAPGRGPAARAGGPGGAPGPQPPRRPETRPPTSGWPGAWASGTVVEGMERPQDAAYLLGDAALPARGPAPGRLPGAPRPRAARGLWQRAAHPGPGPAGAGPALAGAGARGVPGGHPAARRPGAREERRPRPPAPGALPPPGGGGPRRQPAPGGRKRRPGGGPREVAARAGRLAPAGAPPGPRRRRPGPLQPHRPLEGGTQGGRPPGAPAHRAGVTALAGLELTHNDQGRVRRWWCGTARAGPTASQGMHIREPPGPQGQRLPLLTWARRPIAAGSSTAGAGATAWAWTRPAPTAWPWKAPPTRAS